MEQSIDQEKKNVNEVFLRGYVVFKHREDNWLIMTISCYNQQQDKRNYPRVFWYDENIEKADAFEQGNFVEVDGKLQTSKQYRNPSIVGIDIRPTTKELDQKFGVKHGKGKYPEDVNEVRLRGELARIYTPETEGTPLSIITVRTWSNERIYFPTVVCFGRQHEKLEAMHRGDDICVLGHIQTRKMEQDGKTTQQQSVVAHYMYDNDLET